MTANWMIVHEGADEAPIYIRPEHIVSFQVVEDKTKLNLSTGDSLYVIEKFALNDNAPKEIS